MKKHLIILSLIFFISAVQASVPDNNIAYPSSAPKYESRAVWLTTIGGLDWPHNYARDAVSIKRQKDELISILDKLKEANINMVFLQARVRGTVIYPSDIEPWDGCMSGRPGTSPGYDPLQFAIDECHKRGMELHAWIVSIPLGRNDKEGVKHMKRVHPELYLKIKDHGFMRPEKDGTGDYIASICNEITKKYDVDGIHLDYIRYPEEAPLPGQPQWKRDNITRIVKKVHDAVKPIKPWVKLTCSPVGKYNTVARYSSRGWNAYSIVFQDAQGWLRDGLMDGLLPMMYFQGNDFYPFAADWQENSYGRLIIPGLGIYFMHPKEKNWSLDVITREMYVLRQMGMGHAFFRNKFFTDNTKGLYNQTRDIIDPYPSLIPPMTWMNRQRPSCPKEISISERDGESILSWKEAENNNDSPYLLYNVYCSDEAEVDINDARNLIATRMRGTELTLTDAIKNKNFAVTAIDRYGNESKPYAKGGNRTKNDYLPIFSNNGRELTMPVKPNTIDADYLLLKDLAGKTVTTLRWSKYLDTADISMLEQGVYQVYTLNHKGITHRLGFFKIEREQATTYNP